MNAETEKESRAVFVQYSAEEKNKVSAMQSLERAQPSLKIKGGMTFNAKKHTETERR